MLSSKHHRIAAACLLITLAGFASVVVAATEFDRIDLPHLNPLKPESLCGIRDSMQDVELYDGTLGVSKEFVSENARSTVRFRWPDDQKIIDEGYVPGTVAGMGWCTGTLVHEAMVLTAAHCFDALNDDAGRTTPFRYGNDGKPRLSDPRELAKLQLVDIGYQRDPSRQVREPMTFQVKRLVEHRPGANHLDFAIVELEKDADGKLAGDYAAPSPVAPRTVVSGEPIVIFQHPDGKPKMVEAGTVKAVNGGEIRYDDVDTWGGSSGAAIMSAEGDVIGVHLAGNCQVSHNEGISAQAIAEVSDEL
ncbi:hypothetical protein PMI07_006326 [Rhizobium sp. CF080]|nr:hypothetical protein PMI07_006326 [Rhizobium sp. CF080]